MCSRLKNKNGRGRIKKAVFRFYEELNDLLPPPVHNRDREYRFMGNPSIKDAIEAQGVPHSEVDLIIVDQKSVGFDYRLQDGDRVAVYPVFEGLDISPLVRLRPEPLRKIKFIADGNLAGLARWLRLFGFDTRCGTGITKAALTEQALTENRIILTRDKSILKHKTVTHGYYVRAAERNSQIREILDRFDLKGQLRPFTRCMICNGLLDIIEKERCFDRLPEDVKRSFNHFKICRDCAKIYWEGTHYTRMQDQIKALLAE